MSSIYYDPAYQPKWSTDMGKNKNVSLTHEEIWDDSALVQSWDDAVEEYQLYHSIHAKGENIEDVLKSAEENGTAAETKNVEEEAESVAEKDANPESEDVAMVIEESTSESAPKVSQPVATSTEVSTGAMPHPVMANIKDEALKNLMMSWYYAGYYTGLHEGQQQATQGKT
ncbi:uncharacterized protein N7529_000787 [Penicillium soppii]|uniref:uncharacterized protein n=1 Tax=Penicillium soppii TaxID=69789 RepID=UPI002546D9F9|nr:uncharacterized protein N7529_000787 [Penicillium soppii]KAJ5882115.1 hypothetical protein N7529_000787 [Penicillium soppii]